MLNLNKEKNENIVIVYPIANTQQGCFFAKSEQELYLAKKNKF